MNKGSTLFKASGIVAIVIGGISCMGFMAIFPLITGIALIFGGINFLKYADYTEEQILNEKTPIIIWIVVFFIFGMIITGVLSLVAYLNVTNANSSSVITVVKDNNSENENKTVYDSKIEKLEKLDNLRKQGLLTEEEYNSLKKELLGE